MVVVRIIAGFALETSEVLLGAQVQAVDDGGGAPVRNEVTPTRNLCATCRQLTQREDVTSQIAGEHGKSLWRKRERKRKAAFGGPHANRRAADLVAHLGVRQFPSPPHSSSRRRAPS